MEQLDDYRINVFGTVDWRARRKMTISDLFHEIVDKWERRIVGGVK